MTDTAAATVITAAPVVSGDPRVYTDPYPGAKGTDLVKEDCWKCGGDGMYHAPSGFVIQNPYGPRGDAIKGCFACRGVGHRWVKVSSVRARIRRGVTATLQRDADADVHAAAAAARAAEDFAADWEEAHAEHARRAALNNTPAGDPGQKLAELTGTVVVAANIEVTGFRGHGTDIKRLIVVTLDSGQAIKAFGTGSTLFAVNRGDRVTVSGTVKELDTYRGQLQTVLTRTKLRVEAAAPTFDINSGDQIETGGDWYPVLRVNGDDVHIHVTLGERSWTSRIRRDAITAHRPA
ncbi:hypothetical protein [Mycolicibacterium tusciae]|uniref:hypothetical protein n=1 Tax=Mycolicibacterium tusciae TaxID=75922 RepID=UPI00024A3AB9|nr:hypothetical protein [Mycolicibacterium tusciae]